MARKKVTHSEEWWAMLAEPTDVRCEANYKAGGRCRRVAVVGTTVCSHHGGSAPQVRQVAAARIGNAADEMVKRLHSMLDDPAVVPRDKIKIAQDMLDRAGLNATEKHIIGVGQVDPVEALFRDLLSDPSNLMPADAPDPVPDPQFEAYNRQALEAYGGDDVVEAEWVEVVPAPSPISVAEPDRVMPPHILKAMRELGL